jgi:hypothetical protein
MECGHKFRTVKAAERASFGPNGCPGCGGSDIDLAPGAEHGLLVAAVVDELSPVDRRQVREETIGEDRLDR